MLFLHVCKSDTFCTRECIEMLFLYRTEISVSYNVAVTDLHCIPFLISLIQLALLVLCFELTAQKLVYLPQMSLIANVSILGGSMT